LEETRQVSKDTAMRYKDDFEFDLFLETSAKTGYNTQELFVEAAKLLYKEYIVLNKTPKNNQKLKLNQEVVDQKKEKKCCK
jgi:GTPase SAR1 family protein